MPKIRKKTSKRGTTRLRERIKHKSAEAKKKAKKASKNDVTWKSRVKKDPGVPKLFPYRDELIAEQQKAKEQRELDKKRKAVNQEADDTTASTSAAALAEAIQANGDEGFEDVSSSDDEDGADLPIDQALSSSASLRAFARSLRKVLSLSDVLIEVLDARDPLGTRSVQLEKEATQQGKKVVLVLNKIDLVPKETVEAWLAYLRRSWPTLPFRSSTQLQRHNLSARGGHNVGEGSSVATSTQPLMYLLKNYARNPRSADASGPSIKTSITVGVIGFPNVGKSSLINTLKRSRACGVAPTPGYTKDVQEVVIEKGLKVLDCPGVVLDVGEASDGAAERVLRNAVKVEQVADPLGPVAVILRRCRPEHLMMLYSIPAFSSADQTVDERTKEFLIQVARVRGRVKKGGVPDIVSAARAVLRDWNMGKIPYYTVPPALPPGEPAFTPAHTTAQRHQEESMQMDDHDVGSAKIVTELAPAFDLDALFAAADGSALAGLKGKKDLGSVVRMEAMADEGAQVKLLGEEDPADADEDMAEASPPSRPTVGSETVSLPPKRSKRVAFEAPVTDDEEELGIGQNRAIARQAKKDKKRKTKAAARVLREQADDDMAPPSPDADDRPYSFSEFFAAH